MIQRRATAALSLRGMPRIEFTLNGQATEASYEPGMHFLEVLREECGVVSPKDGCAPEGTCGCCLVLIDGYPALACLRKPEQMSGHDVVTVEGLADDTRRILGEAFVLEGGVQCGFCIPGIVIRAASLMRRGVTDDRQAVAKALDGHLCRCTGYGRIIDAIQTAGEACRNGGRLTRSEPRRHLFFGEEFGLSRNPAFVRSNGANSRVRLKADTTEAPVRLQPDTTDATPDATPDATTDATPDDITDAPVVSGFSRTNGNGNGIGTCAPRLGGMEQTLGSKPFVDDMHVPGMLHGALVLSEHPRARVLAIHTSAAAAMPGVVRVFTAADVPGERGTGLNVPDLPLFVAVGETTCCVGDFLAMVVADTAFRARQAAERVEVDYEVLEPVTDPFTALEPGAPQVH